MPSCSAEYAGGLDMLPGTVALADLVGNLVILNETVPQGNTDHARAVSGVFEINTGAVGTIMMVKAPRTGGTDATATLVLVIVVARRGRIRSRTSHVTLERANRHPVRSRWTSQKILDSPAPDQRTFT